MTFNLHLALREKDFICDLPFCRVVLEDNADFPWIILIPRKSNVRNMCYLTTEERITLMKEIEICEKAMVRLYQPTQTNVAMIGNMTPQLHVHIVCRFMGDKYWPGTVWGHPEKPYLATIKAETIKYIQEEIEKCQKSQS